MLIKWFWCFNCDGTHWDAETQSDIPHLMPYVGQILCRKTCKSCGETGHILQSLEVA